MAQDSAQDSKHADTAMALMQKHTIPASPENYAIWFNYAAGTNKDLVREVENVIINKLKFSTETSAYLYNKYILASRNQKAIDDAAINGQKVLLEVLKVINDFSGETQSYNQNVDQYLEDISHEFQDENVKQVFKQLIEKTTNLKKSGEKISQKLEESKQEINTLKKSLQQVTVESQRDFLTGAYNRKTFEKMFDELALAAKENNTEICLIMIDIDHFKRFNDRFGHLLGDEVLKTVTRSLTDILKGRDVVARFGGEEFVVILPETPIEGAMKVADMIRANIASKELKRKDTGETFGTITISMGVARWRSETDTLPTLIQRADEALYESKRAGRNRVTRER